GWARAAPSADRGHSAREAGPGRGADVANVEWLGALAAHHDGVHVVIALRVVQHERRSFRSDEPTLTPSRHSREDRIRVPALVGEPVLEARRALLVLDAREDPFVDKSREPLREDVAPDAELGLEVVEATRAETGLADEQRVPVIAQKIGAAGDGARPPGRVGALHVDHPTGSGVPHGTHSSSVR